MPSKLIPFFTRLNLRLSLRAWIAIIYFLLSSLLSIWFWFSLYRYLFYRDAISKAMLFVFVPMMIANHGFGLPKTLNWAMNGMAEDYATATSINQRTPGLGDEWLDDKWASLEGWKCEGLGNRRDDEDSEDSV